MSLYNMIHGFNPACILLLPMLGRSQEEYPRFRDCFLSEDKKHIEIYTRVGGGNRNCGYGEEVLYADPNFVTTYDDSFDSTYATYLFKVPEKWQADFDKIVCSKFNEVSDEYVACVKEMFPNSSEVIDNLFRGKNDED